MNVYQKNKWQIQHCNPFSLSFSEVADEYGAELEDEELIDIDEEADLIQAERIVVDAEHGDKDWKKLRSEEKSIADMAELMLAMNLNDAEPQERAQNQAQSQTEEEGWQVWEFMHYLIMYIGLKTVYIIFIKM